MVITCYTSQWRAITRADYCALTSLDTGLDVAHVAYSLMYVHVAWSWPVAVARAAYSRALARRRAVEGGAGGAGRASPPRTASHVYVLDAGPWP